MQRCIAGEGVESVGEPAFSQEIRDQGHLPGAVGVVAVGYHVFMEKSVR
jgi:hypothetical protein